MRNILIIYGYRDFPVRTTTWDHLYCFKKYSHCKCYYLNLAVNSVPWYFQFIKFDLIIFDTTFFARIDRKYFDGIWRKARYFKSSEAVKVMMPQDEFINTDILVDFANEFGVKHIFSVAPESEWHKIYDGLNSNKTTIHTILTGYLDDDTLHRIDALSGAERDVDIGYCAADPPYWHGRHGFLKSMVGTVFLESDRSHDLVLQITTPKNYTFLGDDWFKFLLRCKYTLGVESGTSILDRDGSIKTCTDQYVRKNPSASFEEVEEHCFAGKDGKLDLFAISPRHLEACATKTCQILVEGEYSGVLRSGEHYIEVKKDFSNLEDVIDMVTADVVRRKIIDKAYLDIVQSGIYSYRTFVADILKTAFDKEPTFKITNNHEFFFVLSEWLDRLSWIKVRLFCIAKNQIKKLIRR